MEYKVIEVEGDLIEMALNGDFDVIGHGCNCHCVMGAGIAPQMAKAFGADELPLEQEYHKGEINKLGTIDWGVVPGNAKFKQVVSPSREKIVERKIFNIFKKYDVDGIIEGLIVVNAYTQFNYGSNHPDGDKIPLDYSALELCLLKMNKTFAGKHIGLPWIGCGLAGGDKTIVESMIKRIMIDCNVTIVTYNK
ncbi:macro domain containing protein [Cellulophaga phage phi4:1]|uniref:Macro domain containing protein n=5 Tax=Lightbulbvirus TaxID=1918522 RepID=A0A0S2MWA7_9CAUD|nr:macro domain containing protein [Cellulophaga phage phi4:1]YP_008241497.1 macro domain containing protein [Cellulophaga phage phi17:2]ALO80011.1 macro domain containing protein [Cellulophaga phage phi4:1_13]ALO80208.1 macro domain containing protein [Cellulophaga phage phi4:1_18]ALO80405.1 macro domain containing protein [Cellulophaga phage phi17:2_18]AGO47535.1 macro domain containing protein [Cellulophaga phage phi17:2]AGO49415.1 macro domain containing protein [Cellulophaga phage phi4:1